MDIPIDFSIYLPSPGTYFNYIELLRVHDFLTSENQIEKILQIFGNGVAPLEDTEHSSQNAKSS